uniref:N-acetyltransferase domain-containing protein n=1 Tax=viral metagenome TaxID=1070528 RepID=A0A6C0IJZ0_9ZZZZ
MDILLEKVKCVLITNNNHIQTEQRILTGLYQQLDAENFKDNENIELPYIRQYLEDFNTDKKESFCASKDKGKTGMSTTYLIDSLDPDKSNNSALVVMNKETYDVLGVLSFKYTEWSDEDHEYDNSLYIDAFCTNQQMPMPGIGKLLLTSIIEATIDLGVIANIFLKAATKHSEGFYEKFNFKFTGIIDDKMKEYKYSIIPEPSTSKYGGKKMRKKRKAITRQKNIKKTSKRTRKYKKYLHK